MKKFFSFKPGTSWLTIAAFFILPYLSAGQSFDLDGSFSGANTDELVLSYQNEANEPVIDTLKIIEGKFHSKGTIGGVQRVYLIGKLTSNSMEDPNRGYFFLEPGKVEVSLQEDNFKELEVTGSSTQQEFRELEKVHAPLWQEITALSNKVRELENSASGSDSESKARKGELREQWVKKLDEHKNRELDYAAKNPGSKLSTYLVNYHKSQIQREQLQNLYNNFSAEAKATVYSEAIRNFLGFKAPTAGDKAPGFSTKDSNGNNLKLLDFKGKYLLLDFWAGWCKPCLEKHPALKEIYNQYKDKGLEIVGVSFDKDEKEWRSSIMNENLDLWPQIFVGLNNVREEGSISSIYGVQPIPAYILIGPEGNIIERYLAAGTPRKDINDLQDKLKSIFK